MGIDHPEDILPTRSVLGKRSPLVLVGAASTAAVLFAGLMSFRSGNFNLSQKMMRYRVLAQGATVGVMVATSGVAFADLGKLDQVWKNITLGGSDDEEDGKKCFESLDYKEPRHRLGERRETLSRGVF